MVRGIFPLYFYFKMKYNTSINIIALCLGLIVAAMVFLFTAQFCTTEYTERRNNNLSITREIVNENQSVCLTAFQMLKYKKELNARARERHGEQYDQSFTSSFVSSLLSNGSVSSSKS